MLKELRKRKAELEQTAAAKLTQITDAMPAEDARKIEAEHADILAQVRIVDDMIKRAAESTSPNKADGNEDPASQTPKKARKKKAKNADDDEDDEDEDDGDGEDDGEGGKKRKRKTQQDEGGPDPTDGRTMPVSEFLELCATVDQARSLGCEKITVADCLVRKLPIEEVRKLIFDELAAKSKRGPQGGDGGGMQVIRDEREGVAESMEIALITRMLDSGRGGARIKYEPKNLRDRERVEGLRKQSEQYLSYGLVDIAAACIDWKPRRAGSRYLTATDAMEIFTRAFNSTSDFPNIFQNVLNKSLLARYELHMPTYRELAVERPFNDFRPHPQIRAGEFPVLQPITETGEIKYGTSADTGESVSVVPYGVVFTISRTMLVNDDLGAIDQILGSAGDTVLIFENTTFFTMLLQNSGTGPALLQDTFNVFDATHHLNQAATGAAPSVATIGTARQALRGMKSVSGNYLNAPPRIILTGPAQETVADQMVTAITPTLTTSVNPFSGRLRSVSDANITDDSWYLFVEPARVPCFMYGFLNGSNGPRTRTFEPFGVQGVKISLEHDFGCGAIDYRGAYRSPSY